jgi:hypothetical protein
LLPEVLLPVHLVGAVVLEVTVRLLLVKILVVEIQQKQKNRWLPELIRLLLVLVEPHRR